jgi:hypothetical protein
MIELIQVGMDNVVHSLTTKLSNMNLGALEGENMIFALQHPQSSQAHGKSAAWCY